LSKISSSSIFGVKLALLVLDPRQVGAHFLQPEHAPDTRHKPGQFSRECLVTAGGIDKIQQFLGDKVFERSSQPIASLDFLSGVALLRPNFVKFARVQPLPHAGPARGGRRLEPRPDHRLLCRSRTPIKVCILLNIKFFWVILVAVRANYNDKIVKVEAVFVCISPMRKIHAGGSPPDRLLIDFGSRAPLRVT
jgi:hypothetical protein